MARSRLPLVALMGAMGCTQDASTPDAAPADDDTSRLQRLKGENTGKGGSSIRALSDEERRSLIPRPIPVPEGWKEQAATAPEPEDGGNTPTDLAEQRRQQLAKERVEAERFRKYGKGSGIQRKDIIQIVRPVTDGGTDGGPTVSVKE